ncbi:MAG: radical SAM protein [Bacteriovoracales bacterium]|nr:radical SAM protein [Bacteriovoracales bacterium]
MLRNYFLFLWHIFKINFASKSPYKLNFVITKACNSRCQNCNIWQVRPENELTLEEIRTIAKSYRNNIRWLELTGGEPTLRRDLDKIVRIFYKENRHLLFVHFPTNGLLPSQIESQVRKIKLVGSFKLIVTVSLDGPEEINDVVRGVPGNFKKSIETYNRLKRIKNVDVYFGMTLFKSNYQFLDKTYIDLKKEIPLLKRDDLHFNIGQTSQHYYENSQEQEDISPNMKMYRNIKKFKRSSFTMPTPFNVIDKIYRLLSFDFLQTGKTPIPCHSLKDSIYLSEKGFVYPCSMWNFPIGNIRDYNYNLKNILNLSKTKKALELIEKGKCSHCWTPCEAYQSIIGNFTGVLKVAIFKKWQNFCRSR